MGPSLADPGALNAAGGSSSLARFDAVSSRIPYASEIRSAAVANGIDPLLLASLVAAESSFRPNAVSRCGAQGLTQLMPRTAASLGVTDSFDVQQNLNGGAKYIATQMKRFGRVDLALAAYNAGPGAVGRLGKVPDSTWGYVNRILKTWSNYQEPAK
jgi:soluble lytic murein transglycosylase-like protein